MRAKFCYKQISDMFFQPDQLAQRIEWRGAGKVCEDFKRAGSLFESLQIHLFFPLFVFFFFLFVFFSCYINVNDGLSQTCFKTSCELQ